MKSRPENFDLDGPLADFAREQIKELVTSGLSGPGRMDALVDGLAVNLDERHQPKKPGAEVASDFFIYNVFKPLIRFWAQQLFDKMRTAGEV